MSRGDKDKDVTYSNDPKMVAARVFLGRLPTEQLTKQDIEEIFAKHGKILGKNSFPSPFCELLTVPLLGISLFKGFGFVQFADEKDALKAIEAENNTILKGSKIGPHKQ